MGKTIIGYWLIDAPFSALNNMGMDAGDRTENIVRTKVIRKGKEEYPYVSGQAVRFWWRTTLQDQAQWTLSPIERKKKIAFTAADPITYKDDDLFGYMRAPKGKGSTTLTRVSPLKVSPLVALFPSPVVQDFGVMARQSDDPVPYEYEFYSTILRGIFSIDVESLGVFFSENKSGKMNVTEDLIKNHSNVLTALNGVKGWKLSDEQRLKRLLDALRVIPYLQGGAKLATNLTDVSPKFLALTASSVGNHFFLHLFDHEDLKPVFKKDVITTLIQEHGDYLLSKIYLGRQPGFLDDIHPVLLDLQEKYPDHVVVDTVKGVVDKFIEEITTDDKKKSLLTVDLTP